MVDKHKNKARQTRQQPTPFDTKKPALRREDQAKMMKRSTDGGAGEGNDRIQE